MSRIRDFQLEPPGKLPRRWIIPMDQPFTHSQHVDLGSRREMASDKEERIMEDERRADVVLLTVHCIGPYG